MRALCWSNSYHKVYGWVSQLENVSVSRSRAHQASLHPSKEGGLGIQGKINQAFAPNPSIRAHSAPSYSMHPPPPQGFVQGVGDGGILFLLDIPQGFTLIDVQYSVQSIYTALYIYLTKHGKKCMVHCCISAQVGVRGRGEVGGGGRPR